MPAAAKPRSLFGHQLRAELDRQAVTTRELARRIHRAKPDKWKDPTTARRSIARWLKDTVPTNENRRDCASALGLDATHFGTADDEEEEAELYATIADALNSLVRRAVDRANGASA